jgi:hypothetical protein
MNWIYDLPFNSCSFFWLKRAWFCPRHCLEHLPTFGAISFEPLAPFEQPQGFWKARCRQGSNLAANLFHVINIHATRDYFSKLLKAQKHLGDVRPDLSKKFPVVGPAKPYAVT